MNNAELIELVQKLGQPRVLVLGDLMLDRYVWGDAARISQEAPVILLRVDRREERLGGASSVATMLRAWRKVAIGGVVGADTDGGRIRQLLTDLSIDTDGVLTDNTRPSTVKERYIGRAQHKHPQQMLRVDYEVTQALDPSLEHSLCHWIEHQLRKADIVLISDYAKGVCTPNALAAAIAGAKACGIRVLIDPTRGGDYGRYRGCSALTPNRLEASLATRLPLDGPDHIMQAGARLVQDCDLEAAIITLDKDGMALAHRDGRHKIIPTRPRQVYDITGAGDMVLSVLGMALAAGAEYENAIAVANVAGGLEVEKIGVATVTRDEILSDLLRSGSGSVAGTEKVLALPALVRDISCRRQRGQRIAFTNGCFDLLHAGHVEFLQCARAQADVLIVGLNSDAGIRSLKGPERPINPLDARLRVLTSLQAVDYVVVFDEQTPLALIETLRPDVLIKGADYRKEDVVGAAFVESYGGRVYLAPLRAGYSTTGLLEKLRAA